MRKIAGVLSALCILPAALSAQTPKKEHDFSFLTPEYLARFDGVMMMTNGKQVARTEENCRVERGQDKTLPSSWSR